MTNLLTVAGFQAGPTFLTYPIFPYFFMCSYLCLLFSENALLSLLFSPKMFEVTKNCNFFPCLVCSLGVGKIQINLIYAAVMQKIIKYSYFSFNSFYEDLFWYFLSMVILFCCSEKNLFAYYIVYLFLSPKTLKTSSTIRTFHD